MENEVLEIKEKVTEVEVIEEVEEEQKEEIVKPYTLRKLKAEDTFKVLALFKKIGIKRFTTMLQNEQVQDVIRKIRNKKSEDIENDQLFNVGAMVFEIGDVLIEGLSYCENETFILLESMSNLTVDEIKALDLEVLIGMLIDVYQENKGFLMAVSKYFK